MRLIYRDRFRRAIFYAFLFRRAQDILKRRKRLVPSLISVVQSSGTITFTLGAGSTTLTTTANNAIIGSATTFAHQATPGVAFSDNKGGSYTNATNTTNIGTNIYEACIGYAVGIAGGSTTVSANGNSAASGFFVVVEVSGLLTSGQPDATTVTNNGTSATAPNTGNITTATANDYLACCLVANSTISGLSAGWNSRMLNASLPAGQSADRIVSSTGTYSASWSAVTTNWATVLIALKGSAAAPTVLPPKMIIPPHTRSPIYEAPPGEFMMGPPVAIRWSPGMILLPYDESQLFYPTVMPVVRRGPLPVTPTPIRPLVVAQEPPPFDERVPVVTRGLLPVTPPSPPRVVAPPPDETHLLDPKYPVMARGLAVAITPVTPTPIRMMIITPEPPPFDQRTAQIMTGFIPVTPTPIRITVVTQEPMPFDERPAFVSRGLLPVTPAPPPRVLAPSASDIPLDDPFSTRPRFLGVLAPPTGVPPRMLVVTPTLDDLTTFEIPRILVFRPTPGPVFVGLFIVDKLDFALRISDVVDYPTTLTDRLDALLIVTDTVDFPTAITDAVNEVMVIVDSVTVP